MTTLGIMASSVVVGGISLATSSSEVGTALGAVDSNTIPSPTGVQVGDLLVAFATLDSSTAAISASTGWTQISSTASGGLHLRTFARIADGTAADTLKLGTASGGGQIADYCAAILRVTGHTVTNVFSDIGANATSLVTAAIDPPSVAVGSATTRLWLAAAGVDRSGTETITAVPSGYTEVVNLVSSTEATSVTMAIAQRTAAVIDENPGPFTISASRQATAHTLGIP